MRDDRSPGRGYPLPHPENLLAIDADRLRESVLAIDTDYRSLVQKFETLKGEADEWFAQIDAGLSSVDDKQRDFDRVTAEKLASMKEEIADSVRILEGKIAEVSEGADQLFHNFGMRYDELASDLRKQAKTEIERFGDRIPNFDNLAGDAYTQGSKLPAGVENRLEFVEGLGFFRFAPNADDPADGETCIMPTGGKGRWLIELPCFEALRDMCRMTAMRVVRNLFLTLSRRFTWGAIATASSTTQSISFSGAIVGDTVILVPPVAFPAGIAYDGFVSENGTVSITCRNTTSAEVTPPAGIFKIVIVKEGLI